MLVRICERDSIGLVNIVRRPEQPDILRRAGAVHVCDSSVETFIKDLTESLIATKAAIAFDATGDGRLASQILTAMEPRPPPGLNLTTVMARVFIGKSISMAVRILARPN
jgi:hypothetical protein